MGRRSLHYCILWVFAAQAACGCALFRGPSSSRESDDEAIAKHEKYLDDDELKEVTLTLAPVVLGSVMGIEWFLRWAFRSGVRPEAVDARRAELRRQIETHPELAAEVETLRVELYPLARELKQLRHSFSNWLGAVADEAPALASGYLRGRVQMRTLLEGISQHPGLIAIYGGMVADGAAIEEAVAERLERMAFILRRLQNAKGDGSEIPTELNATVAARERLDRGNIPPERPGTYRHFGEGSGGMLYAEQLYAKDVLARAKRLQRECLLSMDVLTGIERGLVSPNRPSRVKAWAARVALYGGTFIGYGFVIPDVARFHREKMRDLRDQWKKLSREEKLEKLRQIEKARRERMENQKVPYR